MTPVPPETINEVDFCAKMASAMNALFIANPHYCFAEARIEGMGSAKSKQARKDLRLHGPDGRIVLTGEVKLPGNIGAFDAKLVRDAAEKSEEANTKYFFTWDVNTFVLWDRSLWDKPLIDRRVNVWPLRMNLASAKDVARRESLERIVVKFLPDLVRDLSDIVSGARRDWSLPPDELFLRALQSHLEWPVSELRHYLHAQAETDKGFDAKLQNWMRDQGRDILRNDADEWRKAVDNAAQTLAYIWTNRFIFYKALRMRFGELPGLELGPKIATPDQALRRLNELFGLAAERSGDYESLLFPGEHDWANDLVFAPKNAVEAWRGFLKSIESVDFRDVPADVVGLIFQKLISPDERHRLGQHFTGPDAVDLINSFCIRAPNATVLDPACGSASFLVRAYYRKKAMNEKRSHLNLLGELFGCDIGLYPAHLATLNLAAREINDEANYPRIDRKDFFDFGPGQPFCHIPIHASGEKTAVMLPELDAVVGNPPYVNQLKLDRTRKLHLAATVKEAFKGTKFSGRSDLHCYFWPHAARFLREGGAFGFLTSSQWLDVDYGFALQGWMLKHFHIVAILESAAERWFPDARVKTCIAILVRCSDDAERRQNPVRFVRLEKPLAEIIGVPATGGVGTEAEAGERLRQQAVDRICDAIEGIKRNVHDDRWRIMVKRQGDLWDDGVRAGQVLKDTPVVPATEDDEDDTAEAEPDDDLLAAVAGGEYVAGKWGRFLRAPDLYFEIMERFRAKFVPLGSVVDIRRGITSGCDAFFMPKDVTDKMLADNPDDKDFRTATGVARRDVVSGKLKIIQDGAGALHPIELEYIKPEVHSLMNIFTPTVHAANISQRIFLVRGDTLKTIEKTWAYRYIKYGEQAIYRSKKAKAVPVPQRSTCVGREHWFDLTKLIQAAFAFWPKGSQYRHLIIHNPEELIGNCRLNCLLPKEGSNWDTLAFTAVLNSTIVALWTQYYGRYTGTEGAMELMVLDVNLVEVPDPKSMTKRVVTRLAKAFKSICSRTIGDLCEQGLKECHSYDLARKIAAGKIVHSTELQQADRRELDDAVFELLGVSDAAERKALIGRLYDATAEHFRAIRVTEIQKMEDRKKGTGSKFAIADQAADAWDSLTLTDRTPLAEWLLARRTKGCEDMTIPSERPVQLDRNSLTDSETVYFGKSRRQHVVCESRGQAELLARIAELAVTGSVFLPKGDAAAGAVLSLVNDRHAGAVAQLRDMAERRSGDGAMREQIFKVLERWFVLGKPAKK